MPTSTNAKKSKITKRTQLSHVDSASCLWRALQFAGLPIWVKYELGHRSRVAEGTIARKCASASCNSTLYLEGYADGQQHHYAVWAARALRERDVHLHGGAALCHHGSQWRGQVHVYEDLDG